MKNKLMLAASFAAAVLIAGAAQAAGVVTIYSADGLHDGNPSWYGNEFAAFTKATGITVQYVEAGSGGIVQRVAKEASNTQADVLVTLPPFIQKAAADGLLQPYTPAGADKIAGRDPNGYYQPVINNYMNFIYNGAVLKEAPKSFDDLLDAKFKGKIQYSTPGQAGDGTAVVIQVVHALGGKDKAFAYLKQLQANNVGPSASTGKLTALVNKGEIYVASGDLQMNLAQTADNPNIRIFWPAGPDGKRSTFALPYYIGLVKGAPNAENGKKLIDFLLSAEAQASVGPVAQGVPVRSDVKPSAEVTKVMEGVDVWTPDWNGVLKDLQADVAAWHQATGS